MTKKKIIGGLIRIEDTFDSGKHKLDNSSDLIYANIDVTTNPNGIDTQKTFTLYRFFNITKYGWNEYEYISWRIIFAPSRRLYFDDMR